MGPHHSHSCIMPDVNFTYFDLQAKGELTRILLNYGNINFKDERISFDAWPGIKSSTPFGQLPVLVWDGEEIAQSMAITRFIARKVGLGGNTDLEFARADSIACHYEDVWTKLPKMYFAKTQEERETLAKEYITEFLPKWLQPLENILKKRGDWFTGTSVTFADLAVMVVLDFLQEPDCVGFKDMNNLEERKKVLECFPLVKANYQRTCALPQVAAYKKQRPVYGGL